MPLVIHPRVRKIAGRVAALTCLAMLAGAGSALADCPQQPVSQPFSQWNDTSDYFLVPGGSFEGSPGWTLSNAQLTPANEPWHVDAATDSQSVTIDAGGSATSPYFCIDNTMPSLRLFAQQAMAGSDLQVQALVQTAGGGVATVNVADLADGSVPAWAPTAPITGNTGSIPSGQTVQVALRFSVPGTAGSWQLDDIYVDPFRSG